MAVEYIIGSLICITIGLIWFFSPSYGPDEPKPISHQLPILGNILPWVKDRRAFFAWGE